MSEINYNDMLHKDTIFLDINAKDSDELFEQVGERLKNQAMQKIHILMH